LRRDRGLKPDPIYRGGVTAESHRTRSWAFVVAFSFIIAVTIGDMVDQGSSIWNWLVIVVCGGFLLQQIYRLTSER
jgi:hypothetical protein